MAGGDDAGALADAEGLAKVLPNDASLTALIGTLKVRVASVEIRRRAEEWRQIFNEGPLDSARLDRLLGLLDTLAKLGQSEVDQGKQRQFLVTVLVSDADKLAAKGEQDAALALIGQGIARLGTLPELSAAQQRIRSAREQGAAAQRAADERARQGQVAISAAPWAQVEAIIDEAGSRMPLPADASTPLLLTLPEGRYRVTLASGQGGARRQEALTVVRGKLATLSVKLPGYSADQYLREAGW